MTTTRRSRRVAPTALLVLSLALLTTTPVLATGPVLDAALAGLQADHVYVHPAARASLSEADANRLRGEIEASAVGPTYVVVLPPQARSEAGGSTQEVVRTLGESIRRNGTYLAVVGDELAALSTELPEGVAPALAGEAQAAFGDQGVAVMLFDLVRRLDAAAREGVASRNGGSERGAGLGLVFLVLLVVAGGALFLSRHRGRHRQRQERLAEVRQAAFDDLVVLGDDLRELDLEVEMPNASPSAKDHYVRALDLYTRASGALDRTRSIDDLRPVTEALEEGRYEIAATRALLEGRQPPERRPPCFFDPRHGPSVRDVEWAPPGGAVRSVPACAADAQRVEDGEEPSVRQLSVAGAFVPYWDAPSYYRPWIGGYFGGFGFLEGLFFGTILSGSGGGVGSEPSWGGHEGGGHVGGDEFGGGDFAGGGFGGGDFAGGDFGGGDFGGF